MIADDIDDEALRLAKAFSKIRDAKTRRMIISALESIALARGEMDDLPTFGVAGPGPGSRRDCN